MAYSTFTLNIRETTVDGLKPKSVFGKCYPLATSSGKRLKKILDSSGHTIITGHVEFRATADQITAGLVTVTLPDPRDTTHLAPNGFGWEVEVTTNYFGHTETFGPDAISAAISAGVVELEAVAAADTSAFEATTNYATASDLASEAGLRVSGDAATLAAAEAYTDTHASVGYDHHQTSAAATWTITHNLGRYVAPELFLDDAPARRVFTDTDLPDANTCVLTFPAPAAGWAHFTS